MTDNEREIPFSYLAAAVAAAGGSVTISNKDILRFQAGYMVVYGQNPAGDLTVTLARRPDTKFVPETDPSLNDKY